MADSFKDVPSRVDVDELEQTVLDFWEREKVFEKSVEQRADGELFTFYDGPPYATGKPHYGHVLQSSIKDTVLRYKTMQGFRVPRRVGWDTHGLPVEVIVEKELGLASKRDVEEFGIEAFNKKCREVVFRYIDEFTTQLKRLGRWAEYDNAYSTLDRDYMESEWWTFKQLWDKDLVYKGAKSVHICPRCATPLSNFEVSEGYKNRTDQSVVMTFPLADDPDTILLAWTTTPWSLAGNLWLLVSPDIEYVQVETPEHPGKKFVLAKKLVEKVFHDREHSIVGTVAANDLKDKKYIPLFDYFVDTPVPGGNGTYGDKCFFIMVDSEGEVSDEDGTGIVHITSSHGQDGFRVAQEEGVPVLHHLNIDGSFKDEARDFAGLNAKPEGDDPMATDKTVIETLRKNDRYFDSYTYEHSYPHCWRCDTPLLNYALDTWFVRVTDFKDQMVAENQKVNWIPAHIKEGRFKKGLESAPDWAVSRNRFWSVPVPIWECGSCDHKVCVGDVAELTKLAGVDDVPDMHRPYVDDLQWDCEKCDGTMQRIEEVLDVWFDSGSMQYAQWHYPFANKELVEEGSPADFIVESIEMTRAWFYVLHVLSVAIKKEPSFTNVIGSGIIFGDDGNKLSKKLKNYPDIEPTVAKYGADTVRMFFLSSTFGEPYVFSEAALQELHRNLYQTLWNVYSFFVRYANANDWKPPQDLQEPESDNVLDQWILARLHEFEHDVIAQSESYRFDVAARLYPDFVDDLSNWYVRRSRNRFQVAHQEDAEDTKVALQTLYVVLVRMAKLVAPFMPFVAENMYQNLTGEDSVHLTRLPTETETSGSVTEADTKLVETMQQLRDVVSAGLALRAREAIKVRQPLAEVVVPTIEGLTDELSTMLAEELNVKKVTVGELPAASNTMAVSAEDEKVRVGLVTELTDDLKAEGIARDIIRHGQQLRRKAGYELNDRIMLAILTEDVAVSAVVDSQQGMIAQALQADKILGSATTSDVEAELKINGSTVLVAVSKANQ